MSFDSHTFHDVVRIEIREEMQTDSGVVNRHINIYRSDGTYTWITVFTNEDALPVSLNETADKPEAV